MDNYNPFINQPFNWTRDAAGLYTDNTALIAAIAAAYVPTVFGLQAFMKDRKPLELRGALVAWNLFLAVFSGLAAFSAVPFLLGKLAQVGYVQSVCSPEYYFVPEGRWFFLFLLSKIPEFVDTIFLCLRKRPVIFLHWFHHLVTMLYCWFAAVYAYPFNSAGIHFAVYNLTVHTIMYSYYALAALGYARALSRLRIDMCLTTLQIVQMMMGIAVLITSTQCPLVDVKDVAFGISMYAAYLVLFAQLFLSKYMRPKRAGATAGKPAAKLE